MKRSIPMKNRKIKIDAIDQKILSALQKNAKITNAALSQKIGLSAAPTLERVRKLEKYGVIQQYSTTINTYVLGLTFEAIVLMKMTNTTSLNEKKFVKLAKQVPNIVAFHKVIGGTDFVLKIVVKDVQAYEKLITHLTNEMQGTIQTKSMTIVDSLELPQRDLVLK